MIALMGKGFTCVYTQVRRLKRKNVSFFIVQRKCEPSGPALGGMQDRTMPDLIFGNKATPGAEAGTRLAGEAKPAR